MNTITPTESDKRPAPAGRGQKGSVLILVMIGLILTFLITSASMTQSTTDLNIARNFQNDKYTFFAVNRGVYEGVDALTQTMVVDPTSVKIDRRVQSISGGSMSAFYQTGSMAQLSSNVGQAVTAFTGFPVPRVMGTSLETDPTGVNATLTMWELRVAGASQSLSGVRKEILSAVSLLMPNY